MIGPNISDLDNYLGSDPCASELLRFNFRTLNFLAALDSIQLMNAALFILIRHDMAVWKK